MRGLLFIAAALVVTGILASVAMAFDSGGNPGITGANTIQWTGNGVTNGELDSVKCAENADSGNQDPNNYLHWILTTDGGALGSDPTLHLGGSGSGDYLAANKESNAVHFFTPFFDLDTLTAYADLDVSDAGNGSWILTISHGCSGGRPEAEDLTVSKDADGAYDDTFNWNVDKSVDKSYIKVRDDGSGGTVTVNYTINDSHGGSIVSNVVVTGTITVSNPNDADVTLDSIEDSLDGNTCVVDTSGGLSVGSGDTGFPYSCDLGDTLPTEDVFNYVKIVWSEQILSDDSHLAANSADFTTPAAVVFTPDEIDECDTLTDTNAAGPQGVKVCVGDTGEVANGDGTFSFIFNYPASLAVPALGQCVDYNNTATSVTNDLGRTPNDSATVRVCHYRAALTPGYWKTHLTTGTPKTAQYLPQLLGNFSVSSTGIATSIWDKMNCSNTGSNATQNQNAIGCLAGHLLATKLNLANGSDPCIAGNVTKANDFLKGLVVDGVTGVVYTGPGTSYSGITAAQRSEAIALKNPLDAYNNNVGC